MIGTVIIIGFLIANMLYVAYKLRADVTKKNFDKKILKEGKTLARAANVEYVKQQKVHAELAYRDFTNSVNSGAPNEVLATKAINAIQRLDWLRELEGSIDTLCLFIYVDLAERDVPLLKKVIAELDKEELPIITDVMQYNIDNI
ncbi:hypothetical protein [Vibrio ziniensis]|uniref:Uncharacterized protein n=1 Tax=Vibrio ziniensis TaxID=2711221 RepID=A0A6G7CLM4_9VIBR|nr:hypothetical protein [Vibrio ziniensis]QIH43031.1 hypothetical protein G5S32_14225 [Vibrio ziniensis]